MDYEKKIKEILQNEEINDDFRYKLAAFFPELKESEDERVRKDIISLVIKWWKDDGAVEPEFSTQNSMLAWLEKQGEHARFIEAIQVGDQVTKNEDGVLVNLSQLNRIAKKDEKQGEQKSAWSEEDEKMLYLILSDINYAQKNFSDSKLILYDGRKVDWLKSLKERMQPQTTWRPSDKQMTALRRMKAAIAGEGEIYEPLNSLYEDLKKLK